MTIVVLGLLGAFGALLLFWVSRQFQVEEDPHIAEIKEILPQANCGGCGLAGCGAFAEACVKNKSLAGMYCPAGGSEVMTKISTILGLAQQKKSEAMIAVVRCSGDCTARPRTNIYDGATSCQVASMLYKGDTDCSFGCLGLGDCELSCPFDAIHINPKTRLPEVLEDKCVGCNACVKACPKMIIELRKKGRKGRRIYVSCINEDKGGQAKKACANACIGCSLCYKACEFDAITMAKNLSYIDHNKCKLCRACVEVCPTNAIHELGFPPKKDDSLEVKKEETKKTPHQAIEKSIPPMDRSFVAGQGNRIQA